MKHVPAPSSAEPSRIPCTISEWISYGADMLEHLFVPDPLVDGHTKAGFTARDAARREARFCVLEALERDDGPLLPPEAARAVLAPHENERIHEVLLLRKTRPRSRIFSKAHFFGHTFAVSPWTLDPRPESEGLVAYALQETAPRPRSCSERGRGAEKWLDWGTGSGCLILSILYAREKAIGSGVDCDPRALITARANADSLGLSQRVRWHAASWERWMPHERFDAIVSNPPYIAQGWDFADHWEMLRWDPARALYAGPDGLNAFRILVPAAARLLKPHGQAFFEIGDGQASELFHIASPFFSSVRFAPDLNGKMRYLHLAL